MIVHRPHARLRPRFLLVVLALAFFTLATVGASGARAVGWGPQSVAAPSIPAGVPIVVPAPVAADADASPSLQRAIDAAASQHGVVLLGSQQYLCLEALSLHTGTTIVGSGPASVLRFTWGINQRDRKGHLDYLQNDTTNSATNHDITLENFVIVGAGDGQPGGASRDADGLPSAVRLINVKSITIDHLKIIDTPGQAITFIGAARIRVTASDIDGSGRGGVAFFPSASVRNANIVIDDNRIVNLGDDGIAITSTTHKVNTFTQLAVNIEIDRNVIRSWPTRLPGRTMQGRGIAVLGAQNVAVAGNQIHDIAESGILVRGSDLPGQINTATGLPWQSWNLTITGNRIWNIGADAAGEVRGQYFESDGIQIDYAGAVTTTANVVLASTITGAALETSHLGNRVAINAPSDPTEH